MTMGQPHYYYYLGARRVPLELVDDTVVVGLTEPPASRRLDALQTGDRSLDALGLAPVMREGNLLVYRVGPAARGADRLRAFAGRLNRGPSVRFVTFAFREPASGLYMIITDEITVRFRPDAPTEQISALQAAQRVEPLDQALFAPNQWRLRVLDPTPHRALDVANALHTHPLVEWAEPVFITETRLGLGPPAIPADLKPRQWHLENTGQRGGVPGEDARVHAAWAATNTRGSADVVIAIMDTGVDMADPANAADTGHPDLQPNIITDRARSFAPSGGPGPDVDPNAFNAHGTGCAGVAAGVGVKISGAAPGCRILPIKVMNVVTNSAGQVTFPQQTNLMAQAFRYAAQHAQVLSNSWSGAGSNDIEQAIRDVMATGRSGKGSVVVFLTHNQNVLMPAGTQPRIPGVIAIGASTNVGTRAGYSNFGDANDDPATGAKRISVLAPSAGTNSLGIQNQPGLEPDGSTENIYTTDIRGAQGMSPGPPTAPDPAIDPAYTGMFSGTSSATPLAAGVCALMLSANQNLTRAQVKYILEATADKIATGQHHTDVPDTNPPAAQLAHYTQAAGHDPKYGYGRVNAEQAMRAAQGQPVRQLVGSAYQQAVPVRLRRVPGTNEFVSDELQLIDARRDPHDHGVTGATVLRGAPGGFIRASFQPTGGGPAMVDELTVRGEP